MINGHYLPVCARDTGIYIGIFSSLLVLFAMKKVRATTIPNIKISLLLLLLLFPLIIDGFSSYLGFYSTTNLIRMTTGILFGITLPLFLVPLLYNSSSKETAIPVLTRFHEIFIPLSLAAAIAFLTYQSLLSYTILHVVIIGTLIFWISLLFMLYFTRLKNRYLAIGLSSISSILVLTTLSYIHSLLQPFYF
ncbi:DUF2085 domain-containing protein [Bacillus sp. FJAT-29790]|nr:DUF2085 domain-containing protein [Bacillus sp. FJAT-29790]